MLRARDLTVRYDDTVALDGVDLDVLAGIVAVIGPSGSGKTTLLRALAGLEPLDRGTVAWGELDLTTVAPHQRGLGLMFQDHALFESRSVRGNVEFGLRMAGTPPSERRDRAQAMLELVGLGDLGARAVDELSGGERQRVALARALAPGPRLLMLDEPLASVDRERRDRLARDLADIVRREAIPTLLVTHDLDEAFTLADTVVVLDRGHVVQTGPAPSVWARPASESVGRFLGVATWWSASISDGAAETPWGPVPFATGSGAHTARVGFRPGDLRVEAGGGVDATVTASWFRRDHYEVELDTEIATMRATARQRWAPGDRVEIAARLDAAVAIPE
jgi:thiamine transport system ATP-binding protein